MVPSSVKAPITIIATGPALHAPADMCILSGSLLQMSSLVPPAMSSKLPKTAAAAKKAHMQRFLVVPQPQYTILAMPLYCWDCIALGLVSGGGSSYAFRGIKTTLKLCRSAAGDAVVRSHCVLLARMCECVYARPLGNQGCT